MMYESTKIEKNFKPRFKSISPGKIRKIKNKNEEATDAMCKYPIELPLIENKYSVSEVKNQIRERRSGSTKVAENIAAQKKKLNKQHKKSIDETYQIEKKLSHIKQKCNILC